MAMKKTVDFAQAEQIRILRAEDQLEWRETRRCDNSCAHFDALNQCCWLITPESTGLLTDSAEGDSCMHRLKEDY